MSKVRSIDVAVIGSGPAGLMAASRLAEAGRKVHIYDAKPSFGRKFLMAGKSGLNITKSEPNDIFLNQYINRNRHFETALLSFLPADIIRWCDALDIETFTGSSGRVFPKAMKASPLLRALLNELSEVGAVFSTRHRWTGFKGSHLTFETPEGSLLVEANAVVFALGGKSWARLGSDGAWAETMQNIGLDVAPFAPSNCGFNCGWDDHFIDKFGGSPVKNIVASHGDFSLRGDFVVTRHGVEGGVIYPLAASVRDALNENKMSENRLSESKGDDKTVITLDLKPDTSLSKLEKMLSRPRGGNSFSNHLRKSIKLTGVKAGLLRMAAPNTDWNDIAAVARAIKSLPLEVSSPRPIDEAISTAGGVKMDNLDENFMLKERLGTFIAGEMLDWDAPTGGYLITACLATGKVAGEGALKWLLENKS